MSSTTPCARKKPSKENQYHNTKNHYITKDLGGEESLEDETMIACAGVHTLAPFLFDLSLAVVLNRVHSLL